MARPPTLLRPLKTTGVRTYTEQVINVGRDKTPILAPEVDADFAAIFNAWNEAWSDPTLSVPPSGPAGGDLVGSNFPDLLIAPGKVTRAKTAPDLWLPPAPAQFDDAGKFLVVDPGPVLAWRAVATVPGPTLPADLGAVLVVDPGPILAWHQVTLPPAPTGANIGQVLGVAEGLTGEPEIAWTSIAPHETLITADAFLHEPGQFLLDASENPITVTLGVYEAGLRVLFINRQSSTNPVRIQIDRGATFNGYNAIATLVPGARFEVCSSRDYWFTLFETGVSYS